MFASVSLMFADVRGDFADETLANVSERCMNVANVGERWRT
jgi:hypothetical protein